MIESFALICKRNDEQKIGLFFGVGWFSLFLMNIAEIPLPCKLKPSLLNLAKRISANQLRLCADDDCIQTVEFNVFQGESFHCRVISLLVRCISTKNAIGYEISDDLAVEVILYARYCTIHIQDTVYGF